MKLELDKALDDGMVRLFGKMAATYPSPIMEQAKDSLADLQAKTLEIAARDFSGASGGFRWYGQQVAERLRATAAMLREGR